MKCVSTQESVYMGDTQKEQTRLQFSLKKAIQEKKRINGRFKTGTNNRNMNRKTSCSEENRLLEIVRRMSFLIRLILITENQH